jgi:hypothetical protein
MTALHSIDPWHELLSTRYVCEICLTRYFTPRCKCPACQRIGHVRPLVSMLLTLARDDEDLRSMIAQGQTVLVPDLPDNAADKAAPEFQI